jgi:hypothetical protein
MTASTALKAVPLLGPAATWTDTGVVEEYTLDNGQRGIRARTAIPAGRIIGVFGGVPVLYELSPDGRITDPDAAQRAIQVAADDRTVYALVAPPGTPLVGIDYINHDCHDPTVTVENQVVLKTARDVAAGEPLRADYRPWDFVHYGERCWCSPPGCVI